MKSTILEPIIKAIDKVFFGFEDLNELEKIGEYQESDNDDEFDPVRSNN